MCIVTTGPTKITWAGHRVLMGLCMQRLSGGLSPPLNWFNEELEVMPRPHTHQDFKDENRALELFSGRKPGTDLGKVESPPPTSESTGTSLVQTQGREHSKGTGGATLIPNIECCLQMAHLRCSCSG